MATPASQEFLVKNLKTTHVVLYPSRAHITRSIENVELQPGPNRIDIYGLTPTADENSVKIDGVGASAFISDMTVDLIPNRELFEDAFPDDSDIESDHDDMDLEYDEDFVYPERAKVLDDEIKALRLRAAQNSEASSAATNIKGFVYFYAQSLDATSVGADEANKVIDYYERQHLASNDTIQTSRMDKDVARQEVNAKQKELKRVTREYNIEKRRRDLKAQKAQEKRRRERQEKQRQKDLVKQERQKFWPKKVYRVTAHIDVPIDTPASSRRGSVTSLTTLGTDSSAAKHPSGGEEFAGARSVSLVLSYVTSDANWSPRYDISFSTVAKTGSIIYTAEFHNATSETWKDTKVSLSTSQATFRGLDDEVPQMNPWHIALAKSSMSNALMNLEEMQHKNQDFSGQPKPQINRSHLFGVNKIPARHSARQHEDDQDMTSDSEDMSKAVERESMPMQQRHREPQPQQQALAVPPKLRNMRPPPAAPAGSMPPPQVAALRENVNFLQIPERGQAIGAAVPSSRKMARKGSASGGGAAEELLPDDLETLTASLSMPELQHEDTTWEDNGLTQTYELPSSRTLSPSSLTRRHKIASLPFQNLMMTYISVPKLRSAAFLRARFRNPSPSITLLKGAAGLTLDGTFLGSTTLPRISPGELMTLSLGVDPSIQVSYSKPTMKRSTQGIFNKEAAQVFTRNMFVNNTKSTPVELLVLDQVPVSIDEKLRVDVLSPKGLTQEGVTVSAGVDAKPNKQSDSSSAQKWGRAKATLKKNGEVAWEVNLEKGGACRLVLEYEVKLPAQEGITSV